MYVAFLTHLVQFSIGTQAAVRSKVGNCTALVQYILSSYVHGRINHGAKRAVTQPPPPPRRKGPPRHQEKNFLGYLIVIYIGNQITDIYAIRYHTSMVHWVIGPLLYAYNKLTVHFSSLCP